MLAIDHVIVAVTDCDRAGSDLLVEHGLASLLGGRHPGHGTRNRIVPLGSSYLELMAVIDEAEAAGSPMGRWVIQQRTTNLVPAALCLRTEDIGTIAGHLGLTPLAMTRTRTDGVTWRGTSSVSKECSDRSASPSSSSGKWSPPTTPERRWRAPESPHRYHHSRDRSSDSTTRQSARRCSRPRHHRWSPGVHSVTIGTTDGEITLAV